MLQKQRSRGFQTPSFSLLFAFFLFLSQIINFFFFFGLEGWLYYRDGFSVLVNIDKGEIGILYYLSFI